MALRPRLEIATFTTYSALFTAINGAHRVELCSNRSADGLTPQIPEAFSAMAWLDTKTTCLTAEIREFGFNFMVRPEDDGGREFVVEGEGEGEGMYEKMKEEIGMIKREAKEWRSWWKAFRGERPVWGFVLGVLRREEGKLRVDEERCRELVLLCREVDEDVRCTFHRAFDRIPVEDMERELEVLIDIGFTSVLTSGGAATAIEGMPVIKKLVDQAAGRIEIVVGGGVRSSNLEQLMKGTGASWFHSGAILGDGEELDLEELRALRRVLDRGVGS